MKPKLSVILPGIRTYAWDEFYQSLKNSIKHSFELIIIGPYDLPRSLKNKKEIKYIKDFGSPSRCQQLGLIASEGEYITWGADDGFFLPDALTEAVDFMDNNKASKKDIVTCKYMEGHINTIYGNFLEKMLDDSYYKMNDANPYLESEHIPDDYWILNVGIIDTEYAKELGGWDTCFEVTTISHMDFAIRTQRNGSEYFMLPHPIFTCSNMPGTTGDHAPVHYAQVEHDQPLLKEIYNNPDCLDRIKIDINNWKNAEKRWNRRFGNV